MLEQNAKVGGQHQWFDIQYVQKDDAWYAFYLEEVEVETIEVTE